MTVRGSRLLLLLGVAILFVPLLYRSHGAPHRVEPVAFVRHSSSSVLVRIAEKTAEQQDLDFMHHWGAGTCPTNVLAAGLALHGDHPEGEKFLRWGLGYFKAAYLQRISAAEQALIAAQDSSPQASP